MRLKLFFQRQDRRDNKQRDFHKNEYRNNEYRNNNNYRGNNRRGNHNNRRSMNYDNNRHRNNYNNRNNDYDRLTFLIVNFCFCVNMSYYLHIVFYHIHKKFWCQKQYRTEVLEFSLTQIVHYSPYSNILQRNIYILVVLKHKK